VSGAKGGGEGREIVEKRINSAHEGLLGQAGGGKRKKAGSAASAKEKVENPKR